jgi:peptidoglycan/LPS O-acetylase OafA/YrhL
MFGIYRFLLALNVVFYHVLDVPGIGPLAVYSFFVLSGFLMTMIMQQTYGYSVAGIRKYALNRFLRLFPTYWVLLALAIGLMFLVQLDYAASFHSKMILPATTGQWLANLFMFYPEFNPVSYPVRISPATWALSIEIFFYIGIGLGLSVNKKLTIVWCVLSLILVILYNIEKGHLVLSYGNVVSASLPFAIGSLLFHFKDNVTKLATYLGRLIPLAFVFNIIVVLLCGYFLQDKFWLIFALSTWTNLLFSSLMTIYLFNLDKNTYNQKWDKELGDLSYPVYIIHWSGALFASWLLSTNGEKTIGVFVLGLVITLFVSYFVNKYVSEYIEKVRQRIKR